MTDLQSRAKKWLKSLLAEVRRRDLPAELLPDNGMTVDETAYSLETVGMEALNLQDNPLEELVEEFPEPEKMADEEIGQSLFAAWGQLSPAD